ncbi:MAG: cytochrome c oxidase subunit 3 [Porticoccaceae bacterium]
MFTAFFGQFYYDRQGQEALFNESQAQLNMAFGAINTLLLLTASLFVVLGVNRIKSARANAAARLFQMAWWCGAGFAVNKVFEYGGKLSAGITPLTNDFYMYYYVFTGIHVLHLLIGMVFLGYMRQMLLDERTTVRLPFIEVGASYWHLVDLLWVVLFPILYIVN